MPLASGAFIQDRGAVMMQTVAFPSGYINDSIYGYDDGVNKWIAVDLDSLVSCKRGGIYSNGSDMTTKLNTLLSSANVKGVKFDVKGGGGITISGTVTVPVGKTLHFENGTYLTGTGTINGGIISAGFRQKIFDTTLTIVPEALSLGKWSVRWFGAVGSGLVDDQPAIQKTIDSAIVAGIKHVYMPAGTYFVGIGILIRKGTNLFCAGFELEGEVTAYDGSAGQTKIITTNKNTFMVAVHKGKGVRISNIYTLGANSAIAVLSLYNVCQNPATDFTGGCRNTTSSPHAGFIVDPFVNDPAFADKYPDFTQYYVVESSGGSTDVIFNNCRAGNLIVGYCLSPHSSPQNGDVISINNCWGDSCKSAISIGQSQNRTCLVNNFKCWGHTETVLDSYTYGDLTGDCPEVDGLNIAGSVRYLCKLTTFANKGLIIKRGHFESLYMLNGVDQGGDLTLENCRINLQSTTVGSPAINDAYVVFKGGSLRMIDCMFFRYNSYFKSMGIDCNSAYFERCLFDKIPINYGSQGQLKMVNCISALIIYRFGTQDNLFLTKPADLSANNPILLLSEASVSYSRRNRYVPLGSPSYLTRKRKPTSNLLTKFLAKEWNLYPITSGTLNFTNIDAVNLTADIVIGAGDDYNKVKIGDTILLNGGSTILDEYGTANRLLVCGLVTAKNDGTGTISLSYTGRGIDNVTNFTFYIGRQPNMLPYYLIGDCTNGSNVITNIISESLNSSPINITLTSPYFPDGTYIVSTSGTTMTVSNNATSTVTGIDIIGADWVATEYGVFNQANVDKFGYKVGDIIYNTDFVNFPNVYKWRCIKSGVTNTATLPVCVIESLVPTNSFYNQSAYKTVVSSVTETSLLNATYTLPANYFNLSKSFHIRLYGVHSAVSSPNITIKIKLGSTVLLTTGTVVSGNSTNDSVVIDAIVTCYTTGASGTLSAQGFYQETGSGSVSFPMVNTSTVVIDTTTSQVLDVTVQWGTSSSSNTITISDGYIEILK